MPRHISSLPLTALLITAVVAVPALTELGVNPVAAHMIAYRLSQDPRKNNLNILLVFWSACRVTERVT